MKIIPACLFLIIGIIFSAHAQDVLFFKNGTQMEVGIIDQDSIQIRYRPEKQTAAAERRVFKDEIKKIVYADGQTEYIYVNSEDSALKAEKARYQKTIPPKDSLVGASYVCLSVSSAALGCLSLSYHYMAAPKVSVVAGAYFLPTTKRLPVDAARFYNVQVPIDVGQTYAYIYDDEKGSANAGGVIVEGRYHFISNQAPLGFWAGGYLHARYARFERPFNYTDGRTKNFSAAVFALTPGLSFGAAWTFGAAYYLGAFAGFGYAPVNIQNDNLSDFEGKRLDNANAAGRFDVRAGIRFGFRLERKKDNPKDK